MSKWEDDNDDEAMSEEVSAHDEENDDDGAQRDPPGPPVDEQAPPPGPAVSVAAAPPAVVKKPKPSTNRPATQLRVLQQYDWTMKKVDADEYEGLEKYCITTYETKSGSLEYIVSLYTHSHFSLSLYLTLTHSSVASQFFIALQGSLQALPGDTTAVDNSTQKNMRSIVQKLPSQRAQQTF